jgi:hypothetical protein
MSERCFPRTAVFLFRIEQLLQVHSEFRIVTADSIEECSTFLWAHFQGAVEQRLEALPEFRSHIS